VAATKTLTLKVASLVDQTIGTNETYSFEGPAKLEGVEANSDIKGRVEIMRIDEGVNVVVKDTEISVKLNCEKCLKPITPKIKLDNFEKQFLLQKPNEIDDPNDTYLVETKNMTIDLTEALRQEIILHFPVVRVCSIHCKGICPKCGLDLNKKTCDCKVEKDVEPDNKPLAALKSLLK